MAAKELCQLLGGFPLAMVQIGEFMNERGYCYQELLPVYKRSAAKIFARSAVPLQYEHTLNTVWDISFKSLSTEGKILLNLLAFFDPDAVPECLLSNQKANITEPCLSFLLDDFDTVLPHVSKLVNLVETHSLKPTNLELFAELIFRAGTL
ncbi:Tetratricopeptide-like helical [Penicillium paradoxum]|uniref:Tetratricopeptide-like helical n=1 Tax=Penicillium paradoxum TaxID=176176 RepID=UPI002549151E|nr:Tetratricopeptide-like helical [Penicillium paradoxum]KAJ5782627.1 Tetratricopeptide-like helical [Penicillium paradoxum]